MAIGYGPDTAVSAYKGYSKLSTAAIYTVLYTATNNQQTARVPMGCTTCKKYGRICSGKQEQDGQVRRCKECRAANSRQKCEELQEDDEDEDDYRHKDVGQYVKIGKYGLLELQKEDDMLAIDRNFSQHVIKMNNDAVRALNKLNHTGSSEPAFLIRREIVKAYDKHVLPLLQRAIELGDAKLTCGQLKGRELAIKDFLHVRQGNEKESKEDLRQLFPTAFSTSLPSQPNRASNGSNQATSPPSIKHEPSDN